MSEELKNVVDEIDQLYADGDLDGAQEKLTQAIETYGKSEELVAIEAEILLDREDYQKVIEATEDYLSSSEDRALLARIRNARGYAFYYLDDLESARKEQNEAVRLMPSDYTAVMGRAMVHEDLHYLHAALLDLRRASQLDDSEGQPYAIQASIYLRWGEMEECQAALEGAVERDDEDLDSRLELARMYALDRRTNDAIELLTQILDSDLDPEEDPELFAPAALLRSQLSLTLGSTDAALEDALRAKEITPDLPWAYLQIAATKIHAQIDAEGALAALKEAEQLAGNILDLPDLYALYAGVYQMLGKEHKVRKYVQEAEGTARLPGYVYGSLNPVENIPVNPNRPIDFRRLLDDLFGQASKAPNGYEEGLRQALQQVMEQIPQIREENPGIERLEIQIPPAPGMIGGQRTLMMELSPVHPPSE